MYVHAFGGLRRSDQFVHRSLMALLLQACCLWFDRARPEGTVDIHMLGHHSVSKPIRILSYPTVSCGSSTPCEHKSQRTYDDL